MSAGEGQLGFDLRVVTPEEDRLDEVEELLGRLAALEEGAVTLRLVHAKATKWTAALGSLVGYAREAADDGELRRLVSDRADGEVTTLLAQVGVQAGGTVWEALGRMDPPAWVGGDTRRPGPAVRAPGSRRAGSAMAMASPPDGSAGKTTARREIGSWFQRFLQELVAGPAARPDELPSRVAVVRASRPGGPHEVPLHAWHRPSLPRVRQVRVLDAGPDTQEGPLASADRWRPRIAARACGRTRVPRRARSPRHGGAHPIRQVGRCRWAPRSPSRSRASPGTSAGTSPRYTLYHLDPRRGKTAMDAAGVLPSFIGVAVHDGLAAYRQYTAADHALCGAHHLRELAGIAQLTGQQWPSELA